MIGAMALLSASPATTRLASIPFTASSSSMKSDRKLRNFSSKRVRVCSKVQALFDPFKDQPIIKDAVKEPAAFIGGVFTGLLKLDLNEAPLKEWISRTVEVSGLKPEEVLDWVESRLKENEDSPQQIEIE